MGGFIAKEAPVEKDGKPKVHLVTKRRLSGKPAVGSFSSGNFTMQKMRTRSDFCLLKIFEEDVVYTAFCLWATDEKADDAVTYLNFIKTVDATKKDILENARHSAKDKRLKLLKVFSKFVAKGSPSRIKMDSATTETISLAFDNMAADENIFDFAYEKCYQVLKFDYMPRFLISETFVKLEDGTRARRGSSSKVVDMSAILYEKKASEALLEYLRDRKDDMMVSYVELWTQVHDYCKAVSGGAKGDLAESIKQIQGKVKDLIKAGQLNLPKSMEVLHSQTALEEFYVTAGNLLNFLADILTTNVQNGFLKSKQYERFSLSAPPEFILDSTILTLSTFKDDRQLKETKEDYLTELESAMDFSNVLQDTLLSAYYRRYLRLCFCEENYFFVCEVHDLKTAGFKKVRGWMDAVQEDKKDAEGDDEMKNKCLSIYEHFIIDGRLYEVNIPAKIKKELAAKVSSGDLSTDMYNSAEVEIIRFLKHDSFDRFKKHYLFEHFKRSFFVKFSQRNFVVGDQVKVEGRVSGRPSGRDSL
mmetsp:Transcript_21233/g.42385  ORF Transcript_21233/g.42385 Transcript_21233/m.42385 type:complete len:530 (+) Transcript_21233:148-1737(+)